MSVDGPEKINPDARPFAPPDPQNQRNRSPRELRLHDIEQLLRAFYDARAGVDGPQMKTALHLDVLYERGDVLERRLDALVAAVENFITRSENQYSETTRFLNAHRDRIARCEVFVDSCEKPVGGAAEFRIHDAGAADQIADGVDSVWSAGFVLPIEALNRYEAEVLTRPLGKFITLPSNDFRAIFFELRRFRQHYGSWPVR
jgi:hypothetical protein